jgi:hypothetical protein
LLLDGLALLNDASTDTYVVQGSGVLSGLVELHKFGLLLEKLESPSAHMDGRACLLSTDGEGMD